MSRLWLLLFLFCLALQAEDKPKWAYEYHFELKKDEWAKVYVVPSGNADNEGTTHKDVYAFRWTLFDGKRVTVLTNYRKFPKQHTLTKTRGLDAVREVLLADPSDRIAGRVELLLVFTDFDQSKKHGNFDIFIKDSNQRVLVEFDDPRRKREQ